MDDQVDLLSEDSKYSQSFEPDELQQKHVQFAEHPIVFKNVKFHFSKNFTNTQYLIQNKPIESCLKDTDDYIQIQEENTIELTKCSIFIFLIFLSFLFYIIWWTVCKLLQLEVETQVGEYVLKQMLKQNSK